jgi:hypothetical protein
LQNVQEYQYITGKIISNIKDYSKIKIKFEVYYLSGGNSETPVIATRNKNVYTFKASLSEDLIARKFKVISIKGIE